MYLFEYMCVLGYMRYKCLSEEFAYFFVPLIYVSFIVSSLKILEFVRDGDKSVAELMDIGKQLLGRYYCE